MTVTVLEGQSLLDIALQELGSLEGAYNLAVLNGLSLTDSLAAGMLLQLPDVVDKRIVNYYLERNIRPATGKITRGTFDSTFDYTFDNNLSNGIFCFTFDFTFE